MSLGRFRVIIPYQYWKNHHYVSCSPTLHGELESKYSGSS